MSDAYDNPSTTTTIRLALLGIVLIAIIVLVALVPWRAWWQRVVVQKQPFATTTSLPKLAVKQVNQTPMPPAAGFVTPPAPVNTAPSVFRPQEGLHEIQIRTDRHPASHPVHIHTRTSTMTRVTNVRTTASAYAASTSATASVTETGAWASASAGNTTASAYAN